MYVSDCIILHLLDRNQMDFHDPYSRWGQRGDTIPHFLHFMMWRLWYWDMKSRGRKTRNPIGKMKASSSSLKSMTKIILRWNKKWMYNVLIGTCHNYESKLNQDVLLMIWCWSADTWGSHVSGGRKVKFSVKINRNMMGLICSHLLMSQSVILLGFMSLWYFYQGYWRWKIFFDVFVFFLCIICRGWCLLWDVYRYVAELTSCNNCKLLIIMTCPARQLIKRQVSLIHWFYKIGLQCVALDVVLGALFFM